MVLEKAGIPSLYTLKAKAHAMARTCDMDERWPHSKRPFIWRTGEREKTNRMTPKLRFKDICKRDLQALGINTDSLGSYCHRQRCLETHSKSGIITIWRNTASKAEEKRLYKKTVCLASRPTTSFTCPMCDRDCHSRIGLHSHNRCCTMGDKSMVFWDRQMPMIIYI